MPVPDYYQRHKLINTHAHTQIETHQIVPAAHLRVTERQREREREREKDEVRLGGQSKEMQMQMWATL